MVRRSLPVLVLLALPGMAYAQDGLDTGDTAWITTATALVLFMTIPGLAMFYAGLVKSRNVLSLFTQCFAITALVTVLWTIYGYSLAFDTTGMVEGESGLAAFVGGIDKLFLSGVGPASLSGTIPELTFFAFQLTFAIITPALMIGAFAERMKFSAVLWFTGLWVTLCYFPTAHMGWGGRVPGRPWCIRLRRWHRRARDRRLFRPGGLHPGRQTSGIPGEGHATTQPAHDACRYGHVVGRLVWLQRW